MKSEGNTKIVKGIMEESKHFAEWTTPEVAVDTQTFLAEIKTFIAQRELEWDSLSKNGSWRDETAKHLRNWSDKLLKKAGFEVDD